MRASRLDLDEADGARVLADRNLLEALFSILLSNSLDAIAPGGAIDIRCRRPFEDRIEFQISDDGCGIAPPDLEHVFEPFFTTKGSGKGTGLGLAIARNILLEHGGSIRLESSARQGHDGLDRASPLPLLRNRGRGRPSMKPAAPTQSPAILVVDDDEAMARTLQEFLHREGYGVEIALSAAEALAVSERNPGIALALVDLVMPVTDGLGLMEQLHRRNPDLAVVIMTGYGTIETAVEAIKRGAEDYLTKPFDQQAVRKKVTRLMEVHELRERVAQLEASLEHYPSFETFVSVSPAIQRVLERARAWPRRPMRRCFCWERRARGRKCSRERSTPRALGPVGPSSRSIAAPCRATSWRASSSASAAGRSREPTRTRRGFSRRRPEGLFSSTRSGRCRRRPR